MELLGSDYRGFPGCLHNLGIISSLQDTPRECVWKKMTPREKCKLRYFGGFHDPQHF